VSELPNFLKNEIVSPASEQFKNGSKNPHIVKCKVSLSLPSREEHGGVDFRET
jgi:hypothetical protein